MSAEVMLFDYAGLTPTITNDVRAAAERIRIRMKSTAEDIIEIGRDLIAVKERLGHGKFLPWIDAEFGMSIRAAQRFISAYEKFGNEYANLAHFTPSVIYELASSPPKIVTQVEARVNAGEGIAVTEIAKLKAEHKAEVARLKAEAIAAATKLAEQTKLLTATADHEQLLMTERATSSCS